MKHFPLGFTGLLIAALAFGIGGDLLLRDVGPMGVNVTLWCVSVLALVVWLAPRAGVFQEWSSRVPLAAAIFFSILYAWRDAEPLKVLLMLIILGSVALTAAAAMGRSMRAAYVFDYAFDGLSFGLGVISLPIAMLSRQRQPVDDPRGSTSVPVLAVIRGVLLAAPFLVLFGLLLVSADAMFEKLVGEFFDIETIASHVLLTGFFAWAAAATWWMCLEKSVRPLAQRPNASLTVTTGIELNVALGLISLLFISFIAVQARYFFGGHEHVLKAEGLTYADYARRGFFELAWVAAFSLALLVACSQVIQSAGALGRRIYKVIAAVLVVSVLLIIASALHRMSLYIDAYGLTRLRVYTAGFMIWIVTVFLWLYFTIYRERIRRFAFGMLLSGYVATLIMVAINPDALIVRTNLDRGKAGTLLTQPDRADGAVDTEYFGDLSADAIPAALKGFPSLSRGDQASLRELIVRRRDEYKNRPLRTWTIGLQQARTALESFDPGPVKP